MLARRDEIVFAEKIKRDIRTWEYIDNYRKLVEEVMASPDPKTAEQITKRPRYIETRPVRCRSHASTANPLRASLWVGITSSHASLSTSTSQTVMPSRQKL